MAGRNGWFSAYRGLIGLFTPRPKFVYLGETVSEPSLILSNHEAAAGPLTWERYFNKPKRFWAAHEMTEGIRPVFRYLAYYYFPDKKHLPKTLARIVGFIASPFVSLYYSGLRPIATFRDAVKFMQTIRESSGVIEDGSSVILFPEDSSKGYLKKPELFHSGFVAFCERMLRKGRDLPVFVTYFSKKRRLVLVDRPRRYSELRRKFGSRDAIAEALRRRLNELADMTEAKRKTEIYKNN